MKAHELDADGWIINTIIVPSLSFKEGLVDASIGGVVGDRVVDGVVSSRPPGSTPPPKPPKKVTKRQAWLALYDAGKIPAVEAAFDAIESPAQRARAWGEWQSATEVERDSNLVRYMAQVMPLSEADLDDLFRTANYL